MTNLRNWSKSLCIDTTLPLCQTDFDMSLFQAVELHPESWS